MFVIKKKKKQQQRRLYTNNTCWRGYREKRKPSYTVGGSVKLVQPLGRTV